jgi:hypothetical protein
MAEFLGRRLVEPGEFAEVVAFLLSPAPAESSGANIPGDRAQNAPSAGGYLTSTAPSRRPPPGDRLVEAGETELRRSLDAEHRLGLRQR